MSQLADLMDVVRDTPLSQSEQARLFVAILGALEWDVDGVETTEEAQAFLASSGRRLLREQTKPA